MDVKDAKKVTSYQFIWVDRDNTNINPDWVDGLNKFVQIDQDNKRGEEKEVGEKKEP